MRSTIASKLTLDRSYRLPILVSLALHGLLVTFVIVGWQSAQLPKQKITPRYVEATLVTIQPAAEKPKKAKTSTKKVVDLTAKRREQERLKAAAKKTRLAKEKAERERLRKLAEKKKREDDAKQKKAKRLAEQKRQQLERERQQRLAQEAAFAQAMAEEENWMAEQEQAASAQSYVALMAQQIEQSWSRPPSARRGMKCELRIQLVPTGEVINVAIVKSSGNSAFDRSAEQAVKRVGRFEELQKMPSDLFEQYFRQLTLVFNPQDLRL